MITQPWKRQDQQEPIPDPVARDALELMPTEQFECLIRDNLQPVNNDPERWQSLWLILTRDNDLADRAYEALEELREQTEYERDHLPDLTDVQRKRIKKFLRNVETCWNKLEDDGQQRLAWAGTAGKFRKRDQITIQVLVMAIDRHRAATSEQGSLEEVDAELWEALDRSNVLLPEEEEDEPEEPASEMTAGQKVTAELVAAISEHEESNLGEEGFDKRNEILWGVLRKLDLDPEDHYVRRRKEQEQRIERNPW